MLIFALPIRNEGDNKSSLNNDFVAQLVEQYTFNVWVLGSSPNGITFKNESRSMSGFFILYIVYFLSIYRQIPNFNHYALFQENICFYSIYQNVSEVSRKRKR